MKKLWTASILTVCLGLLVTTAWLLTFPTAAFAATGTADCGNGLIATCSAYKCNCVDGIGCTSIDEQGNITGRTPCIANLDFGGGGGPAPVAVVAE